MTTSSGLHAADIATTTPISATASGSELVNKFISYYSDSDPLSERELLAAAATPVSSVSTPSTTVSSTDQMRPAKATDENSTSTTDSEQNGNGSSESSSSLGDSATAAARVLAAWQDRAGAPGVNPTASNAAAAVAVAAAAAAAATGVNNPSTLAVSGLSSDSHATMWLTAQTPGGRLQSTSSTPRTDHASFAYQNREGSAPVTGVSATTQRRPDMGFLALLNSAAAYVAESSGTGAPGSDAKNQNTHSQQQQQQRSQYPQHHNHHSQQQQHHQIEGPHYMSHADMLADPGLTLSGINDSLGRAGAGVGEDQGGYGAHYGQGLTNSEYRDLAQALQHIAATTSGADSSLLSSAADQTHSQTHVGAQHAYVSSGEHMDPMSAAAAVAAAAAAAVGSIGPEHMIAGSGQF
ncbi:hypothetical protein LPJ56_004344, partial [Coemansia sp. RSA 2599]